MKIIVTIQLDDTQKQKVQSAIPKASYIYQKADEVSEEALAQADIILGNVKPAQMLKKAKKLKWIQLYSAGTEGFCEQGLLESNTILTNATGAFGTAISEHMIGMMFMLRKKLNLYYENQKQHKWDFVEYMEIIEGSTVVCLGLGDIGSTFAKKAKALGCHVIGVKRRTSQKPDFVDELFTIDKLDKVIGRADVVAMSMPGNSSTYHIINEKRLNMMKSNAIIINVGRGMSIDTNALILALETRQIAGAALDVTEMEPLPAESKLWELDNILITPHISGLSEHPKALDKIIDICIYNMNAFANDKPLKNIVDMSTQYCI